MWLRGHLSREARLPWARAPGPGVPGQPPLPALPAPTRPPAPGLSSVPRVPTAPLPPHSLFPGHTGGHCSEGRAGQQSVFCGWCLGTPLAAGGGRGGDAEAGLVGGGGSAGWTEVKLEHKGQLPALPSQWGNRGTRAPDCGAGAQRLAHAWTHLGRGGRWAQRPSADGDPRASRWGPRPSYLVVGP